MVILLLTIHSRDLDEPTELFIIFQKNPELHILRVLGIVLAPFQKKKLFEWFLRLHLNVYLEIVSTTHQLQVGLNFFTPPLQLLQTWCSHVVSCKYC